MGTNIKTGSSYPSPFRKLAFKITNLNPSTPLQIVAILASCLLFFASFGFPWTNKIFFIKAIYSGQGGIKECIVYGTIGYYRSHATPCPDASDQSVVSREEKIVQSPVHNTVILALTIHAIALSLTTGLFIISSISRRYPAAAKFLPYVATFTLIITSIAYLSDLILVIVATDDAKSYSIQAGPANWLTVGAWVLIFAGAWCHLMIRYGREQLKRESKHVGVSHTLLPQHSDEEAAFNLADLDALGRGFLDTLNSQANTSSATLLPTYITAIPSLAQGAIERGGCLDANAVKDRDIISPFPIRCQLGRHTELRIAIGEISSALTPGPFTKTINLPEQPLGYAPSSYSSYYSQDVSRAPSKSTSSRERWTPTSYTFSPSRFSTPDPYAARKSSRFSRTMFSYSPTKTTVKPPKRASSTPPISINQRTPSPVHHSHEFPPMPGLSKPSYKPYSTFSIGGFRPQNQRQSAQQMRQQLDILLSEFRINSDVIATLEAPLQS